MFANNGIPVFSRHVFRHAGHFCFLFSIVIITTALAETPRTPVIEDLASAAAQPDFHWQQTPTSLSLVNHGRVVWQHVHDARVGKPYLRFGLLDGTELTRPCPIPDGYPKADHPWHRALWWSWKAINGVNFWEENQRGTEPVKVEVTTKGDGSARIDMTIAYHLPEQAPVATEHRLITVGEPDASGSYFIDWQATFAPADDNEVVFNQNSYTGLALRLAAEFSVETAAGQPAWTFRDSEGRTNSNDKTARWVAYQGTATNGQPAGVAIFDHPENPRYPTWWQTRDHYPYMNPSLACREAVTLSPGQSLALRYRILVYQGEKTPEGLDSAWKAFSDTPAHQ
jgi:hypothetical protein